MANVIPLRQADEFDDRADDYEGEHDREARPTIQIDADLYDNTNAAIAALQDDREVYTRDATLVHVVRVDGDIAPDKRAPLASGTPIIRPLARATLKERLAKHARFTRFDARTRKIVEVLPSGGVVDAVAERGEWIGLRSLTGIIETPTLRPDGTLVDRAGYDRATRFLYLPSVDYLPVPTAPTQADAAAALAALAEVFVDFPFSTAPGRLVPIANLLTLLARPMIVGATPACLYDATTAGSGKTLQTDVISLIATGRPATRMTWPADEIELEKILAAYAVKGARVVPFDNVTRPICGGALDKVLTCEDSVELRILGKTDVPSFRWRAVVMMSGNNLQVQGDTARRVLVARLEPDCERPQDRTGFRHEPLLPWVRAERVRLVCAALTLLRAWVVAERPQLITGTWGSFEAWREVVPQAIAFAGGANVLDARLAPDEAAAADPQLAALPQIMSALERLDPERRGISLRDIIAALYPPGDRRQAAPPDGFDDARSAMESLVRPKPGQTPDATRLGYAFRKARGKWIGDRKLDLGRPLSETKNIAHWAAFSKGGPK